MSSGLRILLLLTLAILPGVWLAATVPDAAQAAPGLDGGAEGGLPGGGLAKSLSEVTGVAISPLLGVSAVGAWQYYRTPPQRRSGLPWFASPYFWAPGLLIALLLASKEVVLGALPLAKKPLDALEVFENKLSALIAAPAVIAMIVATFSRGAPAAETALPAGTLSSGAAHLAGADFLALGNGWSQLAVVPQILLVVIMLLAFFTVWLASHSINLLILLSPFSLVDLILRGIKIGLMLLVLGSALIHPYLGAVVSVVILVVAARVAGWSFRLMGFGTVAAWDLLGQRHRSLSAVGPEVPAFLARRQQGVPTRTYGRVCRDERGSLLFRYRPWLVLPRRAIRLPDAQYMVRRGFPSPLVLRRLGDDRRTDDGRKVDDDRRWREGQRVNDGQRWNESQRVAPVLGLPPRFRGHEEQVSAALQLKGVEESGLVHGARAAWQWLKTALAGPGQEA